MAHNVLAALFNVESQAYQAFSELKAFRNDSPVQIAQAVLLKKANGQITPVEGFDPLADVSQNMVTGGLIGSVLGILGGPLGVLFGASVGAWVGSTGAAEHALAEASLVEMVASRLKDGDVAIIALVQEEEENTLDQLFGRFETVVARWDAAVIQQEVEDAVEVQLALQAQARTELKAKRKAERQEKREAFRQNVKAKFDELAKKFK